MDFSFKKPVLSETTVEKDPFVQFEQWYGEAYRLLGEDASAMALVTADDKQPSARIVYLRGSDKVGFWFFTNYNSNKGKELKKNPNAALLFFWARMDRQVRMRGRVKKLSAKESDTYFASRPIGSQIGAWSSPQSTAIPDRSTLDEQIKKFSKQFEGKKIPRPPYWGGFRFIPSSFEFWQGRESRLHDRITFSKQKNGTWKIERLAP